MSLMPGILDLGEVGSRLYSGRENGKLAREHFQLDMKEDHTDIHSFIVEVPSDFFTMTGSFFMELFGPSIVKAGTKKEFLSKYSLSDFPRAMYPIISDWIDAVLAYQEPYRR